VETFNSWNRETLLFYHWLGDGKQPDVDVEAMVAEAMRQGQSGPGKIMARLYELLTGVLPKADLAVEPEAVNCVEVARFLLDKALRRAAGGCPLMIVCDTDASPADCASLLLTEWGQDIKEARGGRPNKGRDNFREKYLPWAWRLHECFGWTQAKIAEVMSGWAKRPVTQATIGKWLKRRGETLRHPNPASISGEPPLF
jgi:hypothetical protein